MARETKQQKAARTADDNKVAAQIPVGTTYESDLFGTVELGENLGPTETSEGWDIYDVKHSGFSHRWSSALVRAAF